MSEIMSAARAAIEGYLDMVVGRHGATVKSTDGRALSERLRWQIQPRVSRTSVWTIVRGGEPELRTYTLVEIGDHVHAVSTDAAGRPCLQLCYDLAYWRRMASPNGMIAAIDRGADTAMTSAHLAELEAGSPAAETLRVVAGLSVEAADAVVDAARRRMPVDQDDLESLRDQCTEAGIDWRSRLSWADREWPAVEAAALRALLDATERVDEHRWVIPEWHAPSQSST